MFLQKIRKSLKSNHSGPYPRIPGHSWQWHVLTSRRTKNVWSNTISMVYLGKISFLQRRLGKRFSSDWWTELKFFTQNPSFTHSFHLSFTHSPTHSFAHTLIHSHTHKITISEKFSVVKNLYFFKCLLEIHLQYGKYLAKYLLYDGTDPCGHRVGQSLCRPHWTRATNFVFWNWRV